MCPACIQARQRRSLEPDSTLRAACMGTFTKVLRASGLALFRKTQGEMIWLQVKRETKSTLKCTPR